VAFVAYAATMSAFTFHLYPLLIERGLDTGKVVAVMAVIGPSQVLGRVVLWGVVPNASIKRVGSLVVTGRLAELVEEKR